MPDLWAGWSCCPACSEAGRDPAQSAMYHAGRARHFSRLAIVGSVMTIGLGVVSVCITIARWIW